MKSKPPTKRARIEQPSPSTSAGKTSKGPGASELLSSSSSPTLLPHHASTLTSSSYTPFQNIDVRDFKDFPKMSNVLTGDINQMPIEDLDTIQTELETLLCSISLRLRVLDKSKKLLKTIPLTPLNKSTLGEHYDQSHQEKINAVKNIMDSGHGTRTSVSAAAKLVMGSQTPVKTVHTQSSSSASASSPITGSTRKSNNSASAATIGPIKIDKPKKKLKEIKIEKPVRAVQNRTHSVGTEDSTHTPASNQFWEFTDSYCRDITVEDVEKLEKLIVSHKSIPEGIFAIPPLGKYFREDSGDTQSRFKNRERQNDICGPLTQRLVAALVDDRVNYHNNGESEGFFTNRTGLAKALGLDSIGNGPPLESRLRQVLLEQGLLEREDESTTDDEIMAEIKRTQNTLTKLHQYNSDKLKELLDMGKKEQSRVSIRNELEKADNEVVEAYRLITSCRQKKKPLTKKEKDVAARALQNQKNVLDKLVVKSEVVDMDCQ